MPVNDNDKLNRIEELKGRLFSKDFQTKIEHRETFSRTNREGIPDSWDIERKFKADSKQYQDSLFMKTYLFKNLFIFSLGFFILALCYAAYVFPSRTQGRACQ